MNSSYAICLGLLLATDKELRQRLHPVVNDDVLEEIRAGVLPQLNWVRTPLRYAVADEIRRREGPTV